jgi:hypothetical protein
VLVAAAVQQHLGERAPVEHCQPPSPAANWRSSSEQGAKRVRKECEKGAKRVRKECEKSAKRVRKECEKGAGREAGSRSGAQCALG